MAIAIGQLRLNYELQFELGLSARAEARNSKRSIYAGDSSLSSVNTLHYQSLQVLRHPLQVFQGRRYRRRQATRSDECSQSRRHDKFAAKSIQRQRQNSGEGDHFKDYNPSICFEYSGTFFNLYLMIMYFKVTYLCIPMNNLLTMAPLAVAISQLRLCVNEKSSFLLRFF